MARRSPLNPRYQKNTAPAGKTRRSASAAKPKRSGDSKPAAKKADRPTFREAWNSVPTSPEIKRWARFRWALLGVAVVLLLVVLLAGKFVQSNRTFAIAITVGYLAAIGGSLYIDMAVIRPLREKAKAAEKKKDGKA